MGKGFREVPSSLLEYQARAIYDALGLPFPGSINMTTNFYVYRIEFSRQISVFEAMDSSDDGGSLFSYLFDTTVNITLNYPEQSLQDINGWKINYI